MSAISWGGGLKDVAPALGRRETLGESLKPLGYAGALHRLAVARDSAVLYPLIPKPVGLLRRILRTAAVPGALVLDPFARSGTTAQAVLDQNASGGGHRKFVLIEAADRARNVIPRRLAEVSGSPPDYGFYTLMAEHEELAVGRGSSAL